MAGALSEFLDFLDQSMLDLYNDYVIEGVAPWEGFEGNPGQMALVQKHVLPAAAQHVKAAKDEWPTGQNPEDYLDSILSSYDPAVLEQALGETIFEAYDTLMAMWEEAESLEAEHDMLVPNGPHSTEAVWR